MKYTGDPYSHKTLFYPLLRLFLTEGLLMRIDTLRILKSAETYQNINNILLEAHKHRRH